MDAVNVSSSSRLENESVDKNMSVAWRMHIKAEHGLSAGYPDPDLQVLSGSGGLIWIRTGRI